MTAKGDLLSKLKSVLDKSKANQAGLPEWMSPPTVAGYTDSSVSTLAKLRLRGGGPRFCRIGRAIRYRRSDVDDWLASTGRRSTSDKGEGR
jgi:predicted DNA-binding transcriptional regulator AlpA